MEIKSKILYAKTRSGFEKEIPNIPMNLNPVVFIEDTREMWTCGTFFSIGYPGIYVTEDNGAVKVTIGDTYFTLSTTGESLSIRNSGSNIIISSNALAKVDTEYPLKWDVYQKKLLHEVSGVQKGSYGPTAQVGNASVFTVPNFIVDEYGHIIEANSYNISIRDYVEQLSPTETAGYKDVLISYNNSNKSSESAAVRKANGFKFDDATGMVYIRGGLESDGSMRVTKGDITIDDGYFVGNVKGDVSGSATPKIHLSEIPEYGGASLYLYGHVLLQDLLPEIEPNPSSDNKNNLNETVNAYAASPLMVYRALEAAKKYADEVLVSVDSVKYRGTITASTSYPGAFTPSAEIGDLYIVVFESNQSYTDNTGYINGEKVEVGDWLLSKQIQPEANSTTWQEVARNWSIVQTNLTGAVAGPVSAAVGQVALFNSTTGKTITGLPSGTEGQYLCINETGHPFWKDPPVYPWRTIMAYTPTSETPQSIGTSTVLVFSDDFVWKEEQLHISHAIVDSSGVITYV